MRSSVRALRFLNCLLGMVVGLVVSGSTDPAVGQSCNSEYTIKEGETLGQIASRVYGNPSHWVVIYYSNQDRIGSNKTLLIPGLSLRLPCIGTPNGKIPRCTSN